MSAIEAEARDAIGQAGGIGLMLDPGCVLPLDGPEAHLEAVVATVRGGSR